MLPSSPSQPQHSVSMTREHGGRGTQLPCGVLPSSAGGANKRKGFLLSHPRMPPRGCLRFFRFHFCAKNLEARYKMLQFHSKEKNRFGGKKKNRKD